MHFDENLLFHNTGQQKHFVDLVKAPELSANERKLWETAKELLEAGNSYDKATALLAPIAKSLGVLPISKATLNRRLPKSAFHPTVSSSQTPSFEIVRCPTTTTDTVTPATPFDFTKDGLNCLFVSNGTLTTEQLLTALRAQYNGDSTELFAQLQRECLIEPAPSNRACWRLNPAGADSYSLSFSTLYSIFNSISFPQ